MGACYSKQPSLGNSSKVKAPKIKYHPAKDGLLINGKESNSEDQNNGGHKFVSDRSNGRLDRQNSEEVLVVSSSLFLAVEQSETVGKVSDHGVAPSDSGIESIGTIPDDRQENSSPTNKRLDLSKRLERLSRGSCHKCGNFKLDDSAITALLTDSYCLCGPRQAGRPNVNPKCQTHGARNSKQGQSLSDNDTSGDVSSSSGRMEDISVFHNRVNVCNKPDDMSQLILDGDSQVLAPLAHFDSIDLNLNDSPVLKSSKRRSLLSEILDLTDSVCKCDFYSNEYCCVVDTHGNKECGSRIKLFSDFTKTLPEKCLTDVSFESHTSDVTITRSDNEDQRDPFEMYPSCSTTSSPSKTVTLTKNVSFAHEDASEDDIIERACVQSPSKISYKSPKEIDIRNTTSESSSGVYTHSGNVSESLLNRMKDSPKHILSLGSQAALLSISSSEALDYPTEEDLASLDLDSLSRVTSLSYGSIRQLMASTEDLVQPLEDVKRVVIDGEDCVAIPTDTYLQLQSDLASLKQQLLYLSSLMQEVCDRRVRNN